MVAVSRTIPDLVAGSGISFELLRHGVVTGAGRNLQLYRARVSGNNGDGPAMAAHETSNEALPVSPREMDVARLIGQGLSNRQIADQLSISIATVERHTANIFNKLGLHSRTQVAVWVTERGLLPSADS
jgi:DNA-binding NarL/FixJ family response regulator